MPPLDTPSVAPVPRVERGLVHLLTILGVPQWIFLANRPHGGNVLWASQDPEMRVRGTCTTDLTLCVWRPGIGQETTTDPHNNYNNQTAFVLVTLDERRMTYSQRQLSSQQTRNRTLVFDSQQEA